MTNLTPKQRRIITDILSKRLPAQEIRLFGSRARGDAKPWSDLDLVICNKTPVQDLALAEAMEDFDESDLPFHVDLVLWRDLPEAMRLSVREESTPLFN